MLLVLVLVLGCYFGWIAHKARTQRQAVARIKHLGGWVIYDFQEVRGVPRPYGEPRGPIWLRRLIGDELFQEVVRVQLNGLDLHGVDLTFLGDFPELETLNLICTDIGDAGLAQLRRLKLKRLRVLVLSDTGISDSGLACLADFDRLESLDVSYDPVTDAGLQVLRRLENLGELGLHCTPIEGPGLAYLHGLRRLRSVDVRGTKASDADRSALIKAVPGVHVLAGWQGDGMPLSLFRAAEQRRQR
jgi:hypothetical protein